MAIGWLMVAAIVWLSLTPAPPKVGFAFGDKLGHLGAYGLLMYWFCQLCATRAARLAYGCAFIVMGIGLEFAQDAVGYRTLEILDMAANTLGVIAGWSAARFVPPLAFARGERAPAKRG